MAPSDLGRVAFENLYQVHSIKLITNAESGDQIATLAEPLNRKKYAMGLTFFICGTRWHPWSIRMTKHWTLSSISTLCPRWKAPTWMQNSKCSLSNDVNLGTNNLGVKQANYCLMSNRSWEAFFTAASSYDNKCRRSFTRSRVTAPLERLYSTLSWIARRAGIWNLPTWMNWNLLPLPKMKGSPGLFTVSNRSWNHRACSFEKLELIIHNQTEKQVTEPEDLKNTTGHVSGTNTLHLHILWNFCETEKPHSGVERSLPDQTTETERVFTTPSSHSIGSPTCLHPLRMRPFLGWSAIW